MSLPANINADVVTAARLAWNKIGNLLDKEPYIYETNDEFFPFYKNIVKSLFTDEKEEH